VRGGARRGPTGRQMRYGARTPGETAALRRPPGGAALLVAAALLAGVCGCGPDGNGRDVHGPDRAVLEQVLQRQATAVRSGSGKRYLAEIDPQAERYRAAQRKVFENLQRLRLTQWTYRVVKVQPAEDAGESAGPDQDGEAQDGEARRTVAEVRLRYRLRGDDRAPVTATERLAFTERGDRWYVSGELPDSDAQLWEQGEMTVVRGERSSVLGAGRPREELRALAADADRAVTRVDGVWPRPWPHRVVVEAPASLRRMAQLLDAPEKSYEGIAAVTTGESGESANAPADRIVVNPEAYGQLSGEGQQVVLTHETVHVATRTHTGPATPMWLSEGFADWVGYRGTGRTPRRAAAELVRAAEAGELPQQLPGDGEFAFGSDPEELGRAYESSWLACRFIAGEWSEEKLLDFYLRVGDSGSSAGGSAERERAVTDRAMRAELGVGLGEFTERWRSYVRRELL
jgi:hypothetical protein